MGGMTAFWGGIWAFFDGMGYLGDFAGNQGAWLLEETTRSHYALPGLFLSGFGSDETLRIVAIAAVWTGLITTAGNRVAETTGLGKMSSSEAAVLLATEPLWAAVFASFFVGEVLGPEDIIGGALIVAACLATAVKPKVFQDFFRMNVEGEGEEGKKEAVFRNFADSYVLNVESKFKQSKRNVRTEKIYSKWMEQHTS